MRIEYRVWMLDKHNSDFVVGTFGAYEEAEKFVMNRPYGEYIILKVFTK